MSRGVRGLLMTCLLFAFAGSASADDERMLADFPASLDDLPWTVVNDGVMGGRSRGSFRRVEDGILFTGSTNTNGGGFSSIRSRSRAFDLGRYEGIRLRVRGDGRTYTVRLSASGSRRGRMQPSFWAEFPTKSGTWQEIDVPFSRFYAQWRGRRMPDARLDPRRIDSLGLMIYDKRDGRFEIQVDWIGAYRAAPRFSMASYRGAKRPLLLFAPNADTPALRRQLESVVAAKPGFDERDMALVVILGRGPSTADGRAIPAATAKRLRGLYDAPADGFALRLVGKDGGVKRRSDAPVAMQTIFDQIDQMPMRRAEMRPEDDRSR